MVSAYNRNTAYEAIADTHIKNPLLRSAIGVGESLTNTTTQGRTKNKFQQGFLGGVGSSSQFQGANQTIPVMPSRSNDDFEARMRSSNGDATGEALRPSWTRTYAFAPGRGVEARVSNITHTDDNAGRHTLSAVVAPVSNAGVDRFGSGPAPPQRTYQLGAVMTSSPFVATGGEAADVTAARVAGYKEQRKLAISRMGAK